MELYLDAITRILDQRIGIREYDAPAKISLDGYIKNLIERYSYLMGLEENYFLQLFCNKARFDQFRREHEYDIILHKRLRPHIIGCGDLQSLCASIDFLRDS